MDLIKVQSEAINAIGYKKDNQTLIIKFNTGRIYKYSSVPDIIHSSLMIAPSKGIFYNKSIKGKFPENELTASQLLSE